MKKTKVVICKFLVLMMLFSMFISVNSVDSYAASKGKYKLPKKAVEYYKNNGVWVKGSTYTFKFNKKGDIIKISDVSGKAKTTYWKGTRKKKRVVWKGRGQDNATIIYYDKKGHITYSVYRGAFYCKKTYSYSNNWISSVNEAGVTNWSGYYDYTQFVNRTFHSNGMIKSVSMGGTYIEFNQNGLISYLRTAEADKWCSYQYDKKGNVKTVYITEDSYYGKGEYKMEFTYGKSAKVSRRTQSAWINAYSPLHLISGDMIVYDDILSQR